MLTASLGLRTEKARRLSRARSRWAGGNRWLVVCAILALTPAATSRAVRKTKDMVAVVGLNG